MSLKIVWEIFSTFKESCACSMCRANKARESQYMAKKRGARAFCTMCDMERRALDLLGTETHQKLLSKLYLARGLKELKEWEESGPVS